MRRQWSHDLLTMILEKNIVPERTVRVRSHPPFSGQRVYQEKKPVLPSSGRICRIAQPAVPEDPGQSEAEAVGDQPHPLVAVKQEPGTSFPRLKRKHTEVIELDTPSPLRARPVSFEEDEHRFPDVGHDDEE